MAQLKLSLLGPPRIELANTAVDLPRRKILALLVYLAMTRQPHRRDTLATLFWPESDQGAARAALRRELHVLTQTLGHEWLIVARETIGVNQASDLWVDALHFRQHLAQWRAHHPDQQSSCAACQAALLQAVDLYGGDFLSGFTLADCPAFDDWQFLETDGLRRDYASVLGQLVQVYRDQADYESAIHYARRWLALDPAYEPPHRALIQLFAAIGEARAAVRQYEECVRILAEELGVPPEPETTALYEAVRARRWPASAGAHRPTAQPAPDQRLKPAPPGQAAMVRQHSKNPIPFVGRDAEWQALQAAWMRAQTSGTHCAILTGEAGIGKTRLAEELLAWVRAQGSDGVYARAYAAQRQAANPGGRNHAAGGRQPKGMGGMIHSAPGAAAFDAHGAGVRINPHAPHQR
jgi:DNA-binding SARP family transcriptional activator